MPSNPQEPFREFRMATGTSTERRETWTRLLLWSPVFLLIIFAVVGIFILPTKGAAARTLVWLAVITTIGGIVGGYTVGIRFSVERARRGWLFVLTGKDIIRKRDGWPDDTITFAEIDEVYEYPGGLTVRRSDPPLSIFIPREVNGFAIIRAELAKHHRLFGSAKPPRPKLSGTGLVVWIVVILSWVAIAIIFYHTLRRH